ncbi:phosphatidylinositol 4-kinase [Plasmodium falciparum RAJ116]|uniref:Phosphatidylinositol 4-kinase n=1 Tax=Plasmodium falciparum RAJ116 TaxID=580058 RepID=A0A0L0CXZ8_PLAFA|nr:phosphatidylinositol 4-kinase [Plasmodium falciparum RAJ116]
MDTTSFLRNHKNSNDSTLSQGLPNKSSNDDNCNVLKREDHQDVINISSEENEERDINKNLKEEVTTLDDNKISRENNLQNLQSEKKTPILKRKNLKQAHTTPCPKLPPCYIINSGSLSIARAKVKLPSTYSKLGNPLSFSKFSLPDFNYSYDMIEELQQFFMKQRRCDYFSLLNNFINLLISVSNLLAAEPDIDLRNELLRRFIYSLNSWMNMRRCIVACCENIFAMTGLCIPLESMSSSTFNHDTNNRLSYNNLQILHFNNEECKIFFSKKRAPYLLMFEVADLDEDISHISDNIFYTKKSLFFQQDNNNNNDTHNTNTQ